MHIIHNSCLSCRFLVVIDSFDTALPAFRIVSEIRSSWGRQEKYASLPCIFTMIDDKCPCSAELTKETILTFTKREARSRRTFNVKMRFQLLSRHGHSVYHFRLRTWMRDKWTLCTRENNCCLWLDNWIENKCHKRRHDENISHETIIWKQFFLKYCFQRIVPEWQCWQCIAWLTISVLKFAGDSF